MDKDRIFNAFLAGWCADAAGARLEFKKCPFSLEQAINAMHFVGDKSNGIPEGQYTDDTEMELCLLRGLLKGRDELEFPVEFIAQEYIRWHKSKPFDIGMTTRYALLEAKNAEDMATNAYNYNETSESNGSLMRCFPLAVFCQNKPLEVVLDVASIEASLTHYSPIVKEVTGIYCFLLSRILARPPKSMNSTSLLLLVSECILSETVADWYNIAVNLRTLQTYNAVQNEGHVKHAFIFIVYFLKNIDNYSYETALQDVFKCGGDTDTNGKIVGNLFGAYCDNCVPEYMKQVVLNYDCTKANPTFFKRPAEYGIKSAIQLVESIC